MPVDKDQDFGALIYEMPSDRFRSFQAGARLVAGIAVTAGLLLSAIAVVGGASTGSALFAAFGVAIAAGFLGLAYGVRRWITHKDSLKVFENALVPLSRPRGAPAGRVLTMDEIVSIEGNARGGEAPSSFVFTFVDAGGRRYRVDSGTLSRFDRSRANLLLVYGELEKMRRAVLRRGRPL
jgi:hypothetical protein